MIHPSIARVFINKHHYNHVNRCRPQILARSTDMIVRVRTRDGTERVNVPSSSITVAELKAILETELKVPRDDQTLSTSLALLTSKDPSAFVDMADEGAKIADVGLAENGSVVHVLYSVDRTPTPTMAAVHNDARGLTGKR